MSRDLTNEERKTFIQHYGTGKACQKCGNEDVVVKIWEKHGSNASKIGGDIGPEGIVGAIVACDNCSYAETVDRAKILGSKSKVGA